MKIFVSGKITGLPVEEYRAKFQKAKEEIEEKGHTAVLPTELITDPETPWEDAMDICLAELVKCQAIYSLPCWRKSTGAQIERKTAIAYQLILFTDLSRLYTLVPEGGLIG